MWQASEGEGKGKDERAKRGRICCSSICLAIILRGCFLFLFAETMKNLNHFSYQLLPVTSTKLFFEYLVYQQKSSGPLRNL